MNHRGWIASSALLASVLALGAGLAGWKYLSRLAGAGAAGAEPAEAITVAIAAEREHRPTATSIGTVLALRSVSLRNEVAGTVASVNLTPGEVVEAGTLLVALDVAVEEAELKSYQAQADLAHKLYERIQTLGPSGAASVNELDRLQTERDVAQAQIERTKAVIARKTIRAPFRARIGIADLHVGQYLQEGTLLTTLQGVDDAVHVDFTVAQRVAAGLRPGDAVEVFAVGQAGAALPAKVVAVDARVDPATRNATVRARLAAAEHAPAPGAAVRVRVPAGPISRAVAVPVNAVRKGPEGDHVFVVAPAADGQPRARLKPVRSGPTVGDQMLIFSGLQAGEQVAALGSFKLREDALVAIADPTVATAPAARSSTPELIYSKAD